MTKEKKSEQERAAKWLKAITSLEYDANIRAQIISGLRSHPPDHMQGLDATHKSLARTV